MLAQLSSVYKSFGALHALLDVDLELRAGEVLALLGPNGAGKTTAIALMLGLTMPDRGAALLRGQSPLALRARQGMGVMLQNAGIAEQSKVAELLTLTRSYYPNPKPLSECVALAGLDGLLTRCYGTLSGGQQRRVQFALAICGNPEVLFLDEPTTGLDIEAREALWRAIRSLTQAGTGVLLTTHYLEEAEALASRVAVLNRGAIIAQGSMQEIRAHVSQKRIRCQSQLAPDVINCWPHVSHAELDGVTLNIVTEAPEAVLRQLLAADPTLSELEIARAGLAEAFVALTQDTHKEAIK
jgi:ABC-2 type transport system ATP-binding protein